MVDGDSIEMFQESSHYKSDNIPRVSLFRVETSSSQFNMFTFSARPICFSISNFNFSRRVAIAGLSENEK